MEEKIVEKTAEAVMNNEAAVEAVKEAAEQAIKHHAKPKPGKGGIIGFAAGMVVTIIGSLVVVKKINSKQDGEVKEKKVFRFRKPKKAKDAAVEEEAFDDEETTEE